MVDDAVDEQTAACKRSRHSDERRVRIMAQDHNEHTHWVSHEEKPVNIH